MLLVVGGIKGGSGKTTLATNLAVCRALKGKKVLLIDGDEQRTTMDWAAQRLPHSFLEESVSKIDCIQDLGKNVYKKIQKYIDQYDDIIIDTGGRDTDTQRSSLVKCNVFLIPLRPKSFDMWTLDSIKNLIFDVKNINPLFRVIAVLNQCPPRCRDLKDARDSINEKNIECVKTEIGYRKSFSDASSMGFGVSEFKKSDKKSNSEIWSLHDDIYMTDMLNISNKDKNTI